MTRPRTVSRRFVMGSVLGGGLASVVLAACGGSADDAVEGPPPPEDPTAIPASTAVPTPTANPAVTLEEKIGQMLMVGFRGFTVPRDEPIYQMIASNRLGSVVLFDYDVPNSDAARNIQSPSQLSALDVALQDLAPGTLLVATDQEGGLVARLKPKYGFLETYSAQALGDLNDVSVTRERSKQMALTLRKAGVNLNLAPVVDVNTNPTNPIIGAIERSFSANPDLVTKHAGAFIDAHHEAGVLTTLKHFPGHGSSRDDSHRGFVDVTDTWVEDELIPYRDLIKAGKADAVMTAHVFNAKLDPDYPATLSKRTITGVLRDRLGFDGVVITDDMQMGAIANFYSFDTSLEVAINAGADVIAIANNSVYDPDIGGRASRAVLAAVQAGRVSEARIDESYRRIVALKARLQA